MKKIIRTILSFIVLTSLLCKKHSEAQVLYDDITWEKTFTNARTSANFGTFWDHQIISYPFLNNTEDISGNQEFDAVRRAFDIWENNANLIFVEVNPINNPDIEISWVTGRHANHQFWASNNFHCPFDTQNGVLAHVVDRPPPGFFFENSSLCGDIHFDNSEDWSVNIQNGNNQPIDLVTVAAHEIGHSLGLAYSNLSDALMFASYNGSHRFLHSDDISAINELYPGSVYLPMLSSIDYICSPNTATVRLSNIGNNTTTWTSSSNIKIISSSNTSATIKAVNIIARGNTWVRATLSNGVVLTENFEVDNVPTVSFDDGTSLRDAIIGGKPIITKNHRIGDGDRISITTNVRNTSWKHTRRYSIFPENPPGTCILWDTTPTKMPYFRCLEEYPPSKAMAELVDLITYHFIDDIKNYVSSGRRRPPLRNGLHYRQTEPAQRAPDPYYSPKISIQKGSSGYVEVEVSVSNKCGCATATNVYYVGTPPDLDPDPDSSYGNSYFNLSVSPNPADDISEVTVTITRDTNPPSYPGGPSMYESLDYTITITNSKNRQGGMYYQRNHTRQRTWTTTYFL